MAQQYARGLQRRESAVRMLSIRCSYTALVLRYAITDSKCFASRFAARKRGLLAQVSRLAADSVDYIQLREKDLDAGKLFVLAEEVVGVLRDARSATKLMLNARADVAVAAGAHGVHLTSSTGELSPHQVRDIYRKANALPPVVSISCHTQIDVEQARAHAADIVLFGPVFEKRVAGERILEGVGLLALRDACLAANPVPVFALGGIHETNRNACVDAGAAGIAGIRLFGFPPA